MNNFSKAAITSLLIGTSALSHASNFYALADFGSSSFDFSVEDFNDSKQSAFDLGAGYVINENFSLELAYRDLGNTFKAYDIDSGGQHLDVTVIQLSGIGKVMLDENLDLYGRLGYGRIDATVKTETYNYSRSYSVSENRLVGGVGMIWAQSENIDIHVEYTRYAKVFDNTIIASLMLGLNYHFK